ncbi:MAG: DNA primase [Geodermatophilaceae bacterium]|nr:DNA primase [Geodermatophilaceae bacterium]
MAGRIRSEDIALVRERSPIADVVGEHLQLRNAGGGSLKGLCPFHDEKTPSFQVTPSRGLFFCFGCSEGGDVIRFVERVDHLNFVESVERLAQRAGIALRYEEGGSAPVRQQGQRARLVEAHQLAADFYAEQLRTPDAQPARDFLNVRGFDQQAAETYGCGYAPATWDALTKHLLGKGFSHAELVTAGLAKVSSRGTHIDRFHRRLLWPIRDITADVIGFGARKLFDDDEGPKYLNTPETPIYKKSNVLFGLDLAKREIARRRQAVVVEGYTDVMACHLAGVPTAVASCGTSFGVEHISVLRRLLMDQDELRGEVIFTFDGDAAGQNAALKSFREDQRFVAQTFVAIAPDGNDPCELRQAKGDLAVRDLVASREPLVQFVLRATLAQYNLDTVEGRVQALEKAAPMIAEIKDRALRPEYARRLAGWLGMEVEAVIAHMRALGRGDEPRRAAAPSEATGRPRPDDPVLSIERESLKLALQAPALAGPLFDAVDVEAYTHPAYASIRRAIGAAGGSASGLSGPAWVDAVGEHSPAEVVRPMLTELTVESLHCQGEPDSRYVGAVMARLQERALVPSVAQLKSKLQRVNPVEEAEVYARLFGELIALEGQVRVLRELAIGSLG